MGRFSGPLAGQFTAWLRLPPGQRVLDVGCGPGALTAILVAKLGADSVSAIDPSESFVTAARERMPGVDVRCGLAEALPWPDEAFDCAVAQLVVHLMADPPAGISEMARVTRPGGMSRPRRAKRACPARTKGTWSVCYGKPALATSSRSAWK